MREARPWTGFFVGLILGIAIALIVQQAGVWPLDQLLLFGSGGIFAIVGILLARFGREAAGTTSFYLPLVLAVALFAYGALGLADINETGQLNGGCTVDAVSDLDATSVTDSSRRNPFDIDPDGGLSWLATSPGAIMDHTWKIYADVGGFRVPLADGGDPNEGGSPVNGDDIDDLTAYVEEVTNVSGEIVRGVFIVGGDIAGAGPACDGFGFVRLTSDNPFESLVAQIALALAILAILILLTLVLRRGGGLPEVEASVAEAVRDAERTADETGASGGAGGLTAGTRDDEGDTSGQERGAEDLPDRDDLA
jgi:hypothetical protein